jgi:pantoate--beta-alanine ligase
VEPAAFSQILEGKARPDFFRGVATIVCKLFNVIQPTSAYFGQKDISQCILIKRMVQDLNMPVNVRVCETKRDVDGLALSSRNVYLTPSERAVASILFKALSTGKDFCENSSTSVSRYELAQVCEKVLRSEPLVTHIEYISMASPIDMTEMESFTFGQGLVLSSAIRVGSVRLIDNLLVGAADKIIYDPK